MEINILRELTQVVIAKKNPHFPIMYYTYTCKNPQLNMGLPAVVNDKNYYINLSELANGDVSMFIHENYNSDKIIANALVQIFISIYSLHSLGYFHNDTHWGNFLFHRITPGGYIKYIINGKELYIENLGFLWVIWDFSFATRLPANNNNMKQTTAGYNRILRAFMNKNVLGWLSNEYPLSQNIVELAEHNSRIILECNQKLHKIDNAHVVYFDKFIENNKLFIRREALPKGAIVVNANNPYKIGPETH
jgi:serine/threonine protein kinase